MGHKCEISVDDAQAHEECTDHGRSRRRTFPALLLKDNHGRKRHGGAKNGVNCRTYFLRLPREQRDQEYNSD